MYVSRYNYLFYLLDIRINIWKLGGRNCRQMVKTRQELEWCRKLFITGLIVGVHLANGRCRYKVTPPTVGWTQNWIQLCIISACNYQPQPTHDFCTCMLFDIKNITTRVPLFGFTICAMNHNQNPENIFLVNCISWISAPPLVGWKISLHGIFFLSMLFSRRYLSGSVISPFIFPLYLCDSCHGSLKRVQEASGSVLHKSH